MNNAIGRTLRISVSAGVVGLLLAVAVRLRHVNTTTISLVLVLVVLCIALVWGWLEAVVAAIVAGLGLAYFFLPPEGFGIGPAEHWVAFFTFLVTALAAGHLSARANRLRVEAVQRRQEIEKLYQLSDVISQGATADDILQRLGGSLKEILGLEAVAIYDNSTGRVCGSPARTSELTNDLLRDVAAGGNSFSDPAHCFSIVPVREGRDLLGSIGIAGTGVSPLMLKTIAEKVGNALSRARVAESVKESELSRRADDLKSAIYDALAHEARGPLGSINLAATALLSDRPGNPAQQREMVSIIKEEVGRLNQWIDETVSTSYSEHGRFGNKTPHDVRRLVTGALEQLGPLLRDRQVGLQIEGALPTVDCDAEMTQRALKLLLDNALKYSPPGTPITVSSSLDNGKIVISVSDVGPGVPEHEQTRIFEKHYRGSRNSSCVPGTGLGLASAKYLVESQGGEIWMTNQPEGGAVFRFSVPLAIGVNT